ncbi:MAG: nucleotidyltransferase domain-containing protein [Clostridiales bacterium]|jgi:predicted nucleotidyltransferase|nr:nucleotidyltransferase domain-containing protein [Clostridiales bacterium]
MTDIKEQIQNKLYATEEQYNVKIPLAVESGSRGWGFASADSDYDCRFIYVHKKDWYLTVLDKMDFIEYPADSVFDINGWDIRKFIKHIIKSNAVMLEWLSSNEVYVKNERVTGLLQNLAASFFNPIAVSHHYLSIAKNKLAQILSEDTSKLKRYFYVLRPIANLNYIHQHGVMPYMEYDKTLAETAIPPEILSEIKELTAIKASSDETLKIERNEKLIAYFTQEINSFTVRLNGMKFEKNRAYFRADAVFREIIERVWENECN